MFNSLLCRQREQKENKNCSYHFADSSCAFYNSIFYRSHNKDRIKTRDGFPVSGRAGASPPPCIFIKVNDCVSLQRCVIASRRRRRGNLNVRCFQISYPHRTRWYLILWDSHDQFANWSRNDTCGAKQLSIYFVFSIFIVWRMYDAIPSPGEMVPRSGGWGIRAEPPSTNPVQTFNCSPAFLIRSRCARPPSPRGKVCAARFSLIR